MQPGELFAQMLTLGGRHAPGRDLRHLAGHKGQRSVQGDGSPATDARAFMDAFERLGCDAAELRSSAASRLRMQRSGCAPCEYLGRIVSSAQHQRFTPNLAVELARVTPSARIPDRLSGDDVGLGRRRHSGSSRATTSERIDAGDLRGGVPGRLLGARAVSPRVQTVVRHDAREFPAAAAPGAVSAALSESSTPPPGLLESAPGKDFAITRGRRRGSAGPRRPIPRKHRELLAPERRRSATSLRGSGFRGRGISWDRSCLKA